MSTFVAVGNANQTFARLLDEVAKHACDLPAPVVVQHGHTTFSASCCEAYDFMDRERFSEEISRAEVIILHAGAGSVLDTLRAGKTPIIVPRKACYGEHVNDHQVELASKLESEGLVLVLDDVAKLPEAVSRLRSGSIVKSGSDVQPDLVVKVAEVIDGYANELAN
ncbi:MAG: glycosyltransferase [Sedimenticola sp.]